MLGHGVCGGLSGIMMTSNPKALNQMAEGPMHQPANENKLLCPKEASCSHQRWLLVHIDTTSLFTSTKANRSHLWDVNDEVGQSSMFNQIRTFTAKESVPGKTASLLKSKGLAGIETV